MRVLYVLIGVRSCGVAALVRFPCNRRQYGSSFGNPITSGRHGCIPSTNNSVAPVFRLPLQHTGRMAMSSNQNVEQQPAQERDTAEIDPTMRVAEIREKLDALSIDYTDCFDKESLLARLRSAGVKTDPAAAVAKRPEQSDERDDATSKNEPFVSTQRMESVPVNTEDIVTVDDMRQQVGAMSVRALREELASRQMRWAGLLEKRDLVQAVVDARSAARAFSATGLLVPGKVTDVTDDQLRREIAASKDVPTKTTPLLVDVYAVWCGPCQLMSKQLAEAAELWRDSVRVVKIDSDKYPAMASTLRAQALPTLLLFAGGDQASNIGGKDKSYANEIGRIEGAMNKDQLMQWVQSRLKDSS